MNWLAGHRTGKDDKRCLLPAADCIERGQAEWMVEGI